MKKIFSKRFVQVLIVIILLGNGILGYINENVNVKATDVNAKAYKMLQNDLNDLSEDELIERTEAVAKRNVDIDHLILLS